LDMVVGTYTPQDQGARDDDEGDAEEPEPVLGFPYSAVAARDAEYGPISEYSCIERCCCYTEKG
jgi:hypothetical protein